jgi:hypothetical protein
MERTRRRPARVHLRVCAGRAEVEALYTSLRGNPETTRRLTPPPCRRGMAGKRGAGRGVPSLPCPELVEGARDPNGSASAWAGCKEARAPLDSPSAALALTPQTAQDHARPVRPDPRHWFTERSAPAQTFACAQTGSYVAPGPASGRRNCVASKHVPPTIRAVYRTPKRSVAGCLE